MNRHPHLFVFLLALGVLLGGCQGVDAHSRASAAFTPGLAVGGAGLFEQATDPFLMTQEARYLVTALSGTPLQRQGPLQLIEGEWRVARGSLLPGDRRPETRGRTAAG